MPKRFDPQTGRRDYWRKATAGSTPGGHTHPPADIIPQGAGSTLDADLLDNHSSAYFQVHDPDLDAIAALSSTGLSARIAADTWALRSIAAGSSKISVTNGDGVSGNPTIDAVEANFNLGNLGTRDHHLLNGLSDDDHSIYALLAGRSGGQTLNGGNGSGERLDLWSTAHTTKGLIRALKSDGGVPTYSAGYTPQLVAQNNALTTDNAALAVLCGNTGEAYFWLGRTSDPMRAGFHYTMSTETFWFRIAGADWYSANPTEFAAGARIRTTSYFKADVATGTAPVQVTSTTLCTNLNADRLDGNHASAFQPVDADLTAIAALATTGYAARIAADTWALRSIVDAGSGRISVVNGDGVGGNTTLDVNQANLNLGSIGTRDHDLLNGLGDDDHSIYLLLAGRAGGQTAKGGTVTGQALTLQPNSADPNNGYLELDGQCHFRNSLGTFPATPGLVERCTMFNQTAATGAAGQALVGYEFNPTFSIAHSDFSYLPFKSLGTFTVNVASAGWTADTFYAGQTFTSGVANAIIAAPHAFVDFQKITANHAGVTFGGTFATMFSIPTMTIDSGSTGLITLGTKYCMYDSPSFVLNRSGYSVWLVHRAGLYFSNATISGIGTMLYGANDGFYVADQTDVITTRHTALYSLMSSGTNKWCLLSAGSAASAHLGNLHVGATTAPTEKMHVSAGNVRVEGGSSTGFLDIGEYNTTADPSAPADNRARIYVRDDGAGKEQVCVRFNTGAVQVVAAEP